MIVQWQVVVNTNHLLMLIMLIAFLNKRWNLDNRIYCSKTSRICLSINVVKFKVPPHYFSNIRSHYPEWLCDTFIIRDVVNQLRVYIDTHAADVQYIRFPKTLPAKPTQLSSTIRTGVDKRIISTRIYAMMLSTVWRRIQENNFITNI